MGGEKCGAQYSASTICSSAPEPASVFSASIRDSIAQGATMKPTRSAGAIDLENEPMWMTPPFLAHGVERGRALAVPDQVGIAIVLEDRHAILLRRASGARRGALSGMMVPVGFCTVGMV